MEKLILTEEEYLSRNGAAFIPDVSLHKKRRDQSHKSWKKLWTRKYKELVDLSNKRQELRIEYEEKVKSGEILEPSRLQRLMKIAAGHEDRESTHAARRILKKNMSALDQYESY